MVSTADIEQACQAAESALAEFEADASKLAALRRARENLQWLREQYRADAALLQPFLDRLKACSQQLVAAMRAAATALADEYLHAGQMVEAWQARRGICRDALAELARLDNLQQFQAASGSIDVKPFRLLRLPPAQSPERQEIMAIIDQAGLWAETTVLNPSRLLKAVDGGRFAPPQAARLGALCPVETSCRLSARTPARPGEQAS